MPRQPSDNRGLGINPPSPPALSEEQQQEVDLLQAQIDTYTQSLNQARRKRDKIKLILDNFDDVVLGNVIQSILPDLNDPDILGQPIISSTEIMLSPSLVNPDGPFYPYRQFVNIAVNYLIQSDEAVAIISASNGELNATELPYPVWVYLGNEFVGTNSGFDVGWPTLQLLLAQLVTNS